MSVTTSASRIARQPVLIPKGVEVKVQGKDLSIKGPNGHITYAIHPQIQIIIEEDSLKVINNTDAGYIRKGSGSRLRNAITGTERANIANMIQGSTKLFECKLLLVGVGYKAQAKGKTLGLTLGFSHPIEFPVPEGVTIETPTPTEIILKGMRKDKVRLAAAKIRAYRSPEPYKGKGIRYSDEVVVKKETKKK
jgi:large subunit ribosomal protein L6